MSSDKLTLNLNTIVKAKLSKENLQSSLENRAYTRENYIHIEIVKSDYKISNFEQLIDYFIVYLIIIQYICNCLL